MALLRLPRAGLQRYLVPAVLTITLILILQYNFQSSSPAPGTVPYAYQSPSKTDNSQFRWSDVPTRNPPLSITPLPSGQPKVLPPVQHHFPAESAAEEEKRVGRREAVKATFLRCWNSYKSNAWMKDELAPISGNYRQAFSGWAATLVDTLDTLHIMGLLSEFDQGVSAVHKIDFSKPQGAQINVFETTIRYLGGFLAAYDLSGDPILLDKAIEVGEMLYVAFDTPNRMPSTRWYWQTSADGGNLTAASNTLVAEIGSLTVEFTRLSQVTGNPKWFDAVQRISSIFLAQQSQTKLPGMWAVTVDAEHAVFSADSYFTLGGMADSLYEYFPKQYALLGGLDDMYKTLYTGSMATAIKYALFRPMVPNEADILLSGNVLTGDPLDPKLVAEGQHLTCFAGGMFALGGRLFDISEHVEIGRKLVDGCVYAYNALPLGIMPEIFHMVPCESKEICPWNESAWHAAVKPSGNSQTRVESIISDKRLPPGFVDIKDSRYILRPEAIESVFILYRITGEKSFQDIAWTMFENIEKHTKTDLANAGLDDVTRDPSPKSDRMESFWTAETLKYFYLIFSEPDLISLDDYILNTEAHPLRRPK